MIRKDGEVWMSDKLVTDSGLEIYDGSIVMLARFPGTKWVVHKGWYTYNGTQYSGWYFSSIPAHTTLPVSTTDLAGIVVVSNSGCSCVHPGPPIPPCSEESNLKPWMVNELNRAWITVDTMEQLSRLNNRLIPSGKVVRVNDKGDGNPGYYRYNQAKREWETETFGIDTSNFVSKDELSEEVSNQIKDVDLSQTVVEVISENQEVHQTITNIAEESISWREVEE